MWVDQGKKPWRKVEACAQSNCFELGVRGGPTNVVSNSASDLMSKTIVSVLGTIL